GARPGRPGRGRLTGEAEPDQAVVAAVGDQAGHAALAVYTGGRVRLAVTRPRRSSRWACAAVSVTAKIRIWPPYWSQRRDRVRSPASCQGVEPGRCRIAVSRSVSRRSWGP